MKANCLKTGQRDKQKDSGLAAGVLWLVEAGGQRIRGFRHGPDYAFIRAVDSGADAERVIRRCSPAGS